MSGEKKQPAALLSPAWDALWRLRIRDGDHWVCRSCGADYSKECADTCNYAPAFAAIREAHRRLSAHGEAT